MRAVVFFVNSSAKESITVFDTTLRDGEQCPGASMNLREKLEIARQLARLRVDVIEAGFPASSPGDFEAVRSVAGAIKESTVCGLARANDRDISRAAEAIRPARRAVKFRSRGSRTTNTPRGGNRRLHRETRIPAPPPSPPVPARLRWSA